MYHLEMRNLFYPVLTNLIILILFDCCICVRHCICIYIRHVHECTYLPLLFTCTYLYYVHVHVHVIPYSSGEGPVMKILSHSGGILHKLQVLPSKRVHGIRLGPQGVLYYYLCTILKNSGIARDMLR